MFFEKLSNEFLEKKVYRKFFRSSEKFSKFFCLNFSRNLGRIFTVRPLEEFAKELLQEFPEEFLEKLPSPQLLKESSEEYLSKSC